MTVQLTATFKIKTQPTTEPVTTDDLQSHINADVTDDGGKASRVLVAAREMFESHSGVSLMPTVWQCFLDEFPCDDVLLMRGPVTDVDSVTYVDGTGDETELDEDLYQTDIKRTPARLRPAYGQVWPAVRSGSLNGVTIEFTAGFASKDVVPKKATQAVLMLAGSWIENPTMQGQVGESIASAYWALVDAVHWEVFDE